MAFLKYAKAQVIKPAIDSMGWDDVRAKAVALGGAFGKQAAGKAVIQKIDPNKFLLSHCTIIASVDTESPGLPLGRQMVDGVQIDRRYGDYFIQPDTSQYVNNNNDAWERKLLLATFRTFVGGENYVEHLQIPELSKGKIVDAVARDIGDSVYVDILVATNREHKPLIAAVKSGALQTLSMGCQVGFTICSKCGNCAEDETQLCKHIRYQKGNHFIDGLGKQRKIAELCGHIDSEPGSVKFIEASWVANPAFTGAVLRNILSPDEQKAYGQRIQVAFNQAPRVMDPNAMAKAARQEQVIARPLFSGPASAPRTNVLAFDFDDEQLPESEGEGADSAPQADPLDDVVNQLTETIREKALKKLRTEMDGEPTPRADLDENRNETLVREAVEKSPAWRQTAKVVLAHTKDPSLARKMLSGLMLFKSGGWNAVRAASQFNGSEFLAISRLLDIIQETPKIAGEARIYRTVVAVGGLSVYGNEKMYLAACRRYMGRNLTGSEMDALLTKGTIFDFGS